MLYLWGLGAEGLGQLVLLGRRPGGDEELEGDVLRVLGLVELHHRRQATGLLVADGDLGPDLRSQLVERAGAAGPRGSGDGRAGLPLRTPVVPAQAALLGGAVVALTPVAA